MGLGNTRCGSGEHQHGIKLSQSLEWVATVVEQIDKPRVEDDSGRETDQITESSRDGDIS